jgi:hypothetical protein
LQTLKEFSSRSSTLLGIKTADNGPDSKALADTDPTSKSSPQRKTEFRSRTGPPDGQGSAKGQLRVGAEYSKYRKAPTLPRRSFDTAQRNPGDPGLPETPFAAEEEEDRLGRAS